MTNNQFIELGRCDAHQDIATFIGNRAILLLIQEKDPAGSELLSKLVDEIRAMGMEKRALLDADIRSQAASA